jgi:glyoxalase-like protein
MNLDRRSLLKRTAVVGAVAILGTGSGKAQVTGAFTKSEIDRQLPTGDEIFLDHVGHFVRDPDAASSALARAGFAPTPKSIQVNPDPAGGPPLLTGTGNVTAMLRRGYLEILFKTADTPLGVELDAGMKRYAGVHLGAFSVADAAKAHQRLDAAGFKTRPLVQMERPVDTEHGPGKAAFTVVRVEPEAMAEGRIQILAHRTEDRVWQKRWLVHPNTAVALLDVVFAVGDVEEAAGRFARFTARRAAENSAGTIVQLDRGGVQLVSIEGLAALLPDIRVPTLPFAAAYGIAVSSLKIAADKLGQDGLAAHRDGKTLVAPFPPELGLGAWVFVEHAADLPWRG